MDDNVCRYQADIMNMIATAFLKKGILIAMIPGKMKLGTRSCCFLEILYSCQNTVDSTSVINSVQIVSNLAKAKITRMLKSDSAALIQGCAGGWRDFSTWFVAGSTSDMLYILSIEESCRIVSWCSWCVLDFALLLSSSRSMCKHPHKRVVRCTCTLSSRTSDSLK